MDEQAILRHLHAARETGLIAVDTETTGLAVRDGYHYCMGVSIAYRLPGLGIMSCFLPFRYPEGSLGKEYVSLLKDVLSGCDLIFHNRKFDLHSLYTLGIDLSDSKRTHYDCLLLAHMINEEIPYDKELGTLGLHYGVGDKLNKDQVKKWGDLWGWDKIPYDLIAPYATRDAELTYALWEVLWELWQQDFDTELWYWEQEFNTVLYKLERRGVAIDIEFCRVKSEIGYGILENIKDELGFDPAKGTQLGPFLLEELNLPVLERSKKTDKPSFNKHVMEQYEDMLRNRETVDKSAELILEFRGWSKAISALYDPMQRLVSHDGRIRANYKQHGTKTGRLSCETPNLQQLPRSSSKPWNGNARSGFKAWHPDHILYSFDYSQLELRLAACYGNEEELLDEFVKEDADPFTRYAAILQESRQTTKTYFYLTIYEGGAEKAAYTLNRPIAQVEESFTKFKSTIPGIKNASRTAMGLAQRRKYVKLWTGRRRHYPFKEDPKYYTAFNSVLQGGGAEVVKRSMVNLQSIEDDNCFMLMQVHDEVVFSIHKDMIEKYSQIIIPIMEDHPVFPIKLKVEGKPWVKALVST